MKGIVGRSMMHASELRKHEMKPYAPNTLHIHNFYWPVSEPSAECKTRGCKISEATRANEFVTQRTIHCLPKLMQVKWKLKNSATDKEGPDEERHTHTHSAVLCLCLPSSGPSPLIALFSKYVLTRSSFHFSK